ncbi:hypothetical protein [Flavobacterium ammonificans]|uniref:CcmD family protein n=1 Tax=Flavobacterium ammonificans TaxID=1751056 RepID=A0ABM7UZ05_9FLAO|nr:hypothetical protein [Flavobacterium ammonificans]BDB53086.1 hypothetical protein GENT11_13980 [Flavobacterium ammonificans]
MISMYDYKMVDLDFNLENTINENEVLKKNNRALGIILVVAVVALFGVVVANSVVKRLEEETKQRV